MVRKSQAVWLIARQLFIRPPACLCCQLVPYRVVVRFTLLQLVYLLGVWALTTWAGIAGGCSCRRERCAAAALDTQD
jgi:hypothetical protein